MYHWYGPTGLDQDPNYTLAFVVEIHFSISHTFVELINGEGRVEEAVPDDLSSLDKRN